MRGLVSGDPAANRPLGGDGRLLAELVKEPVALSRLVEIEARRLGISKHHPAFHKLYMQIYRFVKELNEQGLLRIEKIGNLLFVAAPLDLIQGGRKIGTTKEEGGGGENPAERYVRISGERREAVLLMWETDWDESYEWEKVKGDIELIDAEIRDLFRSWLDRVSKSYIVLRARYDGIAPEWRVLKSQTRFTSKKRKKKLYARYYAAWEKASERYDEGVFLTLTTDWRRFSSWWDAVKAVSGAWHNFRRWYLRMAERGLERVVGGRRRYVCGCGYESYDRREFREHTKGCEKRSGTRIEWVGGRRRYECVVCGFKTYDRREIREHMRLGCGERAKRCLDFIKVAEFTDSGLLHLHVVVFGAEWLAEKEEITEEWERLGVGKITHLYGIQKDKATGKWVWKRRKPRGARKDVMRYLKKYLSKVFDERREFKQDLSKSKQHLYWATLTRFFTVSRSLIGEGKPPRELPSFYEYFGVFRWDELPIELLEGAAVDYG